MLRARLHLASLDAPHVDRFAALAPDPAAEVAAVPAGALRGLGWVMTKQIEPPGTYAPLASSSWSCSKLCSSWASNASALALLRLVRRQSR